MAEYRIRAIRFSVAGTDLAGDGVVAFSAPLSTNADIVATQGATGAKVFDKGNASHQVTVSVIRRHASDNALESFIVSHPAGITRTGALVVTTGTLTTTTNTASSACIVSVSIDEPEALLTVTTYTIVCSPLL